MTNTQYWRDKRVLVTGSTGLVGSWLCASLVAVGASVVGLVWDADPRSELFRSGTDRRMSIVNGDLADLAAVERAIVESQTDTVFHLGAQTIVGVGDELPLLTFETNIRGTYNLLEACRRHPGIVRRVVVASSDKAYGTHTSLPYKEDFALNGRHPYEVSKACADMLATSYSETYRLPVAIARFGNVYGGGDLNWSRLIPDTIRATLQGRPPVLRSNGKYVRDYVYVNDVVGAYEVLAEALDDEHLHGEAFNFSPERPYTVLEVVETIQDLVGGTRETPILLDTAQGEIVSQYLDSSKAKSMLGWSAGYTLKDGLTETIGWYRKFLADD
ncbi:MAG TPA: GDP-mannose 4,6-dehydratase [Candidatus Dormibacteraeota bacterium]|nr:GDP-mannose 4,6-dehydratase [Candidatus Dormibacteraeota bacterium]